MFDRSNTQVSFFKTVDEDTHLCVGDGVNLLLTKDGKNVCLVSGEVSSVNCLGGCFSTDLKYRLATTANDLVVSLVRSVFAVTRICS